MVAVIEATAAIRDRLPSDARVLIIRPSALGDVCRSVPLAASVRAALPDSHIEWLVRDTCADAVRHHPAVDEVVLFDRKGLGRSAGRLDLSQTTQFLRELRSRQYDLVIDAQGLFRSGAFACATRANVRVGYANARELGWLGLNVRVPVRPHAHTVDRMLALVEAIGLPIVPDLSLNADPEQVRWATERVSGRAVVIAPTSVWPAKRWPADRFREVTRKLLETDQCDRVLVVGGPGERPQCDPILELASSDKRVVDLVGKTSVAQLMALIAGASLVIANDSAAVHMAVGFHRPLVALFGPTKTSLVGPYQRDADVIQHLKEGDIFDHKSPSVGLPMMERISAAEVYEAGSERLTAQA